MGGRGKSWLVAGAGVAMVCGIGLGGQGRPAAAEPARGCPKGYDQREVRVYGQRFEEASPLPGASGALTLIQNDWTPMPGATPDHRYVVALVCTRGLTTAEQQEMFLWGSKQPGSGG